MPMPKTRFLVVISSFLILSLGLIGQEDSLRLMELDKLIADKEQEIDVFRIEQEDIKLKGLNALLLASGLPTDDYVKHDGMYIGWNPVESQAAWVAHIISPDIVTGGFGRTNDFRDDPLIDGEGVEADYFLKELQADST